MTPEPDVSVVVPVFNAADTLRELFTAIHEQMRSLDLRFEVVFADDGSSDPSWQVIGDLKAEHGELVRGFRLARNCGQQAATYCGLLEARGRWVLTLDDDLQPHPREIGKLWEHAQRSHADVVYGVYATLRRGLVRRMGTRMFRFLLRRLTPSFPDGSAFRLIRSEIVQVLPRHPGPWIAVDPVLAWYTSEFSSVTVEHSASAAKRSGYSLPTLFRIAWTMLLAYSRLPLRAMTGLGLLSALVSFGLGIYYLVQRLTVGAQIGFSALIVTITFSSGLILFSLGILGEYISRIHTMGTGQPAYRIKAKL